jgi:WD40 repeat protein
MIATGSMDKSIRFWHTHTLEPLGSVYTDHAHGHKSSVNDLLWLDTETLVSVSDDAQVRCWKITQ